MFLPESIAALSALNKSQTKSTLLKIRIQASPDDRFGIIYIGDIYQETVFLQNGAYKIGRTAIFIKNSTKRHHIRNKMTTFA